MGEGCSSRTRQRFSDSIQGKDATDETSFGLDAQEGR